MTEIEVLKSTLPRQSETHQLVLDGVSVPEIPTLIQSRDPIPLDIEILEQGGLGLEIFKRILWISSRCYQEHMDYFPQNETVAILEMREETYTLHWSEIPGAIHRLLGINDLNRADFQESCAASERPGLIQLSNRVEDLIQQETL